MQEISLTVESRQLHSDFDGFRVALDRGVRMMSVSRCFNNSRSNRDYEDLPGV